MASADVPRRLRRSYLEGRVRPDLRGRGHRPGAAGLAARPAAPTLHAERHPEAPGALTVEVPGGHAVAGGAGAPGRASRAERWYREMQRPLTDLPGARRPCPGVDLVPFTWDRDDEVRRAHNAAFTRHHGSSERDPEAWQSLFTGQRSFRPDLSRAGRRGRRRRRVRAGLRVRGRHRGPGIARGLPRPDRRPAAGPRPGRGERADRRGAARRRRSRTARTAGLGVDTENVTGALRLYEGLGFRTVRTRVSWTLDLPPAAERRA